MENKVTNSGLGFCDLLLVAFIILKICGVINWSWWWVMSPLWISICIALFIYLIYMLLN